MRPPSKRTPGRRGGQHASWVAGLPVATAAALAEGFEPAGAAALQTEKRMINDLAQCGRCGNTMPARLLDAVLLNQEGNEASEEAYCEACFPSVRVIAADRWRPLGDELP
jgi:hypothetical protein